MSHRKLYVDWMGWDGWQPGGVKYRAPYGAKTNHKYGDPKTWLLTLYGYVKHYARKSVASVTAGKY